MRKIGKEERERSVLTLNDRKIPWHYDFLKINKKQVELKSCVLYCPVPFKSKAADSIYRTMVLALPLPHGQ